VPIEEEEEEEEYKSLCLIFLVFLI